MCALAAVMDISNAGVVIDRNVEVWVGMRESYSQRELHFLVSITEPNHKTMLRTQRVTSSNYIIPWHQTVRMDMSKCTLNGM